MFTLVSLYPIYNLFTISYLSGVFVGHLPVMNLKHQYTNKGNRLRISFKHLEVVSRKKPCTTPFQAPTLSGICKLYSFKQKKPHANPLLVLSVLLTIL